MQKIIFDIKKDQTFIMNSLGEYLILPLVAGLGLKVGRCF